MWVPVKEGGSRSPSVYPAQHRMSAINRFAEIDAGLGRVRSLVVVKWLPFGCWFPGRQQRSGQATLQNESNPGILISGDVAGMKPCENLLAGS